MNPPVRSPPGMVCVLAVAFFYGDHAGKLAFIFDRPGARRSRADTDQPSSSAIAARASSIVP